MKLNKKNAGIIALVVVIVLVVWRISRSAPSGDPRRSAAQLVRVEQPHRETVFYTLRYTGDVLPIQQANIFTKVTGNLDRVYSNIGDYTQEGHLLALIDTTELSQQAQLAEATYENARINYERTEELSRQNLVAKQDLDNASAAMKVAKANYDLAQTRLSYAYISAPFSGYITKRNFDPGAVITANNTTVFTLMDLSSMKIIVNVPEKNISVIKLGIKATITVDAFPEKEFEGKVVRYSRAVDLSTRTMAVEVDVVNQEQMLKPGMYATVTFVFDQHVNAITVPSDAILRDERGNFIFAVNGDTARRQPIVTGLEQSTRTEILSGLDGAERVITTGQQLLKDGTPVTIQQ